LLGAYARRDAAAVRRTYAEVLGLFPRLRERERQLAVDLSGGEQQMVAIARGLMAGPRLLLVDELSLGLAPIIVQDLPGVLAEVTARGRALLIVEQDVQSALALATRGYVLEAGEMRLRGPAADLLDNAEVRKAYLGV